MSSPVFNLVAVKESIRKHKRLIILGTMLGIIAGVVVYCFMPYKYTARIEFIVRNPMYGDRTVLYNSDSKIYDYFANDDDIDKVILLSRADMVEGKVIKDMNLARVYNADTTDPLGIVNLYKKFNNNFSIMRTEYRDLVICFKDKDPALAVAVANSFVRILDNAYSGYFTEMRKEMYESIMDKVHDNDSMISSLTDTLAAIRDKYKIFASKYSFILSSGKSDYEAKYGEGIERMQNIELLRDGLVSDRAGQITLINHYRTGLKANQLPVIKVVSEARIINPPTIFGCVLFIIQCAVLGALFSTIIMLFSDNFIANK